jgi:polyribonucleotide nucleotidyltransferase
MSELTHERVANTEDVVKKGDTVRVKLVDRDERGRLRLSMKALEPRPEGMPEPDPSEARESRPPRGDGDRGGRSGGGRGRERR